MLVETTLRTDQYTFAEFIELVPDRHKADLLDGVIYMASPDNLDNDDLSTWLISIMRGLVEARDLGTIHGSRVAFRIKDKHAPEPDIAFLARRHAGRIRRGYVEGPPDLAIELVSPDSVERDYVAKRRIYEEAGVGEYWILDFDERRAMFLRHDGENFVEVKPDADGYIESRVIPGLRLKVDWFWTTPRPSVLTVLGSLLNQ